MLALDFETMRTLPRHTLVHSDGRRLLVYGELRGSLDEERRARRATAPRSTSASTCSPRPGSGSRRRGTRGRSTRRRRAPAPSGAHSVRAGSRFHFRTTRPSSTTGSPRSVPIRRRLRISTARPDRQEGRCEVVLYTDRHDASFGELSPIELARVVAIWVDRGRELWADPAHAYVCVFENRGAEVGATIAHPHGQIYALDHVPPVTAAKSEAHRRHRRRRRTLPLVRRDAGRRPLRPRRLRERRASSSPCPSRRDGRSR